VRITEQREGSVTPEYVVSMRELPYSVGSHLQVCVLPGVRSVMPSYNKMIEND